jgi:hypothetical protein
LTSTWYYSSISPIPGVTKIRAKFRKVGELGGDVQVGTESGFGYYYMDKGVRVKADASTRTLAVQDLASDHKLRIRINGTTYGVPLVDTDHPQAAAVRIYDGSAVRSLVDITP